jgi:hypothetical protein
MPFCDSLRSVKLAMLKWLVFKGLKYLDAKLSLGG